jgi:cell division transport system permease protein
MRALRYALDEAVASLWRGRRSSVLSAVTIALALFVLGAFLILTANLERLAREWSSSAEVSVYLADEVTEDERLALEAALATGGVAGREYVPKTEALARFKRTFGDLAVAAEGLEGNPLPASYEVRLVPGAEADLDRLAARWRALAGVADVRYDRQWLSRLVSAVAVVRGIGLVLGAILTLAAALTVANVVRLALYARRDELDIMQLVGAPQLYVRGPFVVEGTLQGGAGALVALMLLGAVFAILRGWYLDSLAAAVNLSSIEFLSLRLSALLVGGGMAVGCLGGFVAGLTKP